MTAHTTNPALPASISDWQLILLGITARDGGYTGIMDMLESAIFSDRCPGICTGCRTIYDDVEPDATDNHCDHCYGNGLGWQLVRTVKSVLVLAELV